MSLWPSEERLHQSLKLSGSSSTTFTFLLSAHYKLITHCWLWAVLQRTNCSLRTKDSSTLAPCLFFFLVSVIGWISPVCPRAGTNYPKQCSTKWFVCVCVCSTVHPFGSRNSVVAVIFCPHTKPSGYLKCQSLCYFIITLKLRWHGLRSLQLRSFLSTH